MDGYPGNAHQAELLETALTGLDLAAERALIASASVLAPPPPSTLPDLNRPLPSGDPSRHSSKYPVHVDDTQLHNDADRQRSCLSSIKHIILSLWCSEANMFAHA